MRLGGNVQLDVVLFIDNVPTVLRTLGGVANVLVWDTVLPWRRLLVDPTGESGSLGFSCIIFGGYLFCKFGRKRRVLSLRS